MKFVNHIKIQLIHFKLHITHGRMYSFKLFLLLCVALRFQLFYSFTNRFYNSDLYCLKVALQTHPALRLLLAHPTKVT